MKTNYSILKMLSKKLALVLLLAVTTIGAFATLGDGKSSDVKPGKKSLLSIKSSHGPGTLSLRPGYFFRGSQVIGSQDNRYINLNTAITYQNGHTSYTVPLKKKVMLNDRIVFNPNAATRR